MSAPRRRLALLACAAVLAASVPAATGPTEAAAAPRFAATIHRLGPELRRRMTGVSWHPGCPVGLNRLRLLKLRIWGFDGRVHRGRLVVNEDAARPIVAVMYRLFALRYPIRRMRLVDAYGAVDDRSMEADNTSAFNCRPVAGTDRWSEHAYGRAIDLNPIENPYADDDGYVSPPQGAPFADRSLRVKGLVHAGGPVVAAFAAVGWGWGGNWSWPKDYQHFSATGR